LPIGGRTSLSEAGGGGRYDCSAERKRGVGIGQCSPSAPEVLRSAPRKQEAWVNHRLSGATPGIDDTFKRGHGAASSSRQSAPSQEVQASAGAPLVPPRCLSKLQAEVRKCAAGVGVRRGRASQIAEELPTWVSELGALGIENRRLRAQCSSYAVRSRSAYLVEAGVAAIAGENDAEGDDPERYAADAAAADSAEAGQKPEPAGQGSPGASTDSTAASPGPCSPSASEVAQTPCEGSQASAFSPSRRLGCLAP